MDDKDKQTTATETVNDDASTHTPTYHTPHKIKDLPKRRRTARDISYGIQQTIMCFITDTFTDPLFGALAVHSKFFSWATGSNTEGAKPEKVSVIQTVKNFCNEMKDKVKSIPKLFTDKGFRAEYWRQWKSEIAGDLSALVVFVPIRRLLRKPLDNVSHWIEKKFDHRFEKRGRKALEEWKQNHNADDNDPRYQQRLAEFKDERAHNIVDSFLLGALSWGLNVWTRITLFKEPPGTKPATLGEVMRGKSLGVIATVIATLSFKTFAPKASHKVDKFLEKKVLGKVSGWVDDKLGNKGMNDEFTRPASVKVERKSTSYQQQVAQQRDQSEQTVTL